MPSIHRTPRGLQSTCLLAPVKANERDRAAVFNGDVIVGCDGILEFLRVRATLSHADGAAQHLPPKRARRTSPSRTGCGTTTTVASLIQAPGGDRRISPREAITATNGTAGTDTIRFGLPLTDANHYYYRDTLAAGLSNVQPTTLADTASPSSPAIADFDPDYPGTKFSWFRTRPATVLPTITETVIIDGTSQPGYTTTPLFVIEDTTAGGLYGLVLSGAASSGSRIKGLVIGRTTAGVNSDNGIRIVLGSSTNIITGNFGRYNGGGIQHRGLSLGNNVIRGNRILFNEIFYGALLALAGDGAGIFIGGDAAGALGSGSLTMVPALPSTQ